MPDPETTKATAAISFAADKTERRKIAELEAYPNNPRTHSAEQIETLCSMIKEFGFTQPILVDENNMILAGHGRTMAALKLGFEELPAIILRGLTEAQKRAIVIADNQAAELAGWDEKLLKMEIGELKKADFNLDLLGFPELKMVEFLTGFGDDTAGAGAVTGNEGAADRDLTDDEAAIMRDAWRWLARDWNTILTKQTLGDYVSTSYTRGALAVYFLRARFFGYAIPSAATLAYTPHRLFVAGDKTSLADAILRCMSDKDDSVGGLQFVLQGQPRFDKLLGGTLAIRGGRMPGEFPSDIARSLYDEFAPEGGSVLDPCHGWGGRMLGFLLSKASYYEGYDTDPKTFRGVGEMFKDMRRFALPGKTAKTSCEPFEKAKPGSAKFDFAMTSPPYFDVEKYGGEESSWRKYTDFDSWVKGFYAPMIKSVAKALKPGAHFALQVGNQSNPLEATAKDVAATCGLTYIETRHTDMINNYNKTDKDEGEVIVVFVKGERVARDPAEKFGKVL